MDAFKTQFLAESTIQWKDDIEQVFKQMLDNIVTSANLHDVMETAKSKMDTLSKGMKTFEETNSSFVVYLSEEDG